VRIGVGALWVSTPMAFVPTVSAAPCQALSQPWVATGP
jgi:hypothetical protein